MNEHEAAGQATAGEMSGEEDATCQASTSCEDEEIQGAKPGSRCPMPRLAAMLKKWLTVSQGSLNPDLPKTALMMLCVLSLLGYWDGLGRWGDLPAHFRLQYAVLIALCLVLFIIRKQPKWALVALLGLGINVAEVLPAFLPTGDKLNGTLQADGNATDEDAGLPVLGRFRLMQMNVLTSNTNYGKARDAIREVNPDVIALNEVNQSWLDGLAPVLKNYPYHVAEPRDDHFGVALYSRLPFKKSKIHVFSPPDDPFAVPSALGALDFKGQMVTVLATHPLPPSSDLGLKSRNEQLMKIAKNRQPLGRHLVVAGDLNTTPYSIPFKNFMAAMQLSDSRNGFGYQGSWPVYLPVLSIPIDHILVSEDFVVLHREIGPDIGSDHLPVIADLELLDLEPPEGGVMPGMVPPGAQPGNPEGKRNNDP